MVMSETVQYQVSRKRQPIADYDRVTRRQPVQGDGRRTKRRRSAHPEGCREEVAPFERALFATTSVITLTTDMAAASSGRWGRAWSSPHLAGTPDVPGPSCRWAGFDALACPAAGAIAVLGD
jgi:hypothetical protein